MKTPEFVEAMPRHWDIRLIVLVSLGVAAFGLIYLMQNFALNNVPDENVVYIDSSVGGIEDDDLPVEENNGPAPDVEAANGESGALELNSE